uniref:Uncharacterized protein n=1 Tax=Anas platyrhynchos platyrhynchos TaxID=8840 RepID=A0A493TDZ4_ANAPP
MCSKAILALLVYGIIMHCSVYCSPAAGLQYPALRLEDEVYDEDGNTLQDFAYDHEPLGIASPSSVLGEVYTLYYPPEKRARRWDLQQSLQETPGPVVRQEISALSDGQAGRVRLSARSFPRGGRWWALEGTKRIGPPLGMPCAGGGAGLGGTWGDVGVYRGHPEPQPPATAAGELPEQRKPGSSAGVTGGFLGVTRPCAHMCV